MAPVSRRTLLAGGAAGAVLSLSPFGWLQSAVATTTMPRRASFNACIGATFQVSASGYAVNAVLTEVGDLKPIRHAGDPDRYSLVFAIGAALPQGTYTFRQKKLGSVNLFAVPVDRGIKPRCLQVIVNR